MVGLKTFWITISALFLLGACVPQSKQTKCRSNEAFNASLRTCVPVVGGPSSFINVDSFAPVSSITKYKDDPSTMTFEVVVSNPYNQSYSIAWERVFNGTNVSVCSNSPTCSFPASLLGTVLGEVGTHVLIAKIKDGNGTTVDSHNFEIRIVDLPKPIINTVSLNPASYAPGPYYPTSSRVQFSFVIKNNNATINALDNYRTVWTVVKDGSAIYTESDAFTSIAPAGTNTAYLGNSPTPYFNPATLGTGSYIIRAQVQNDVPGEIVAEQQWNLIIQDPPLSPVIARPIYEASTTPAWNTTINAYHAIAYNDPAGVPYNFIPTGGMTQGNFCVRFQDADGTIPGDGEFIRVDYYLDGVTLIHQGTTTAVDNTVCLSDAAAATLSSVVFTNTVSTVSQPHTLVARVFDEHLDKEYTSAELTSGQGTYPLSWSFNVKPQNAGPTASFGTSMACNTNLSTTKSGCAITSDTNFTVGLNFLSDDFYTVAANEANLDYSFRLYRNGSVIQTCNKSDPGADGTTDAAGSLYECVMSIPGYDANGPINVTTQTYEIRAELLDDGSPLSTAGAASNTYRWNLVVTESNTVPVISNWSVSGAASEGVPMTFSADIADAQRDNHTYEIKYCTDAACTTSSTLTSGPITRTSDSDPYNFSVNYTLPEDFLLGLTTLGCNALIRGQTCAIDFFLVIKDVPHTAAPLTATSGTVTSTITHVNPAPTLLTEFSSPAPSLFSALTSFAFVGHPISISNNPSSILTDTSAVAAEKSFRYQWFVKNNTSVTAWTEIEGATGNNLIWTPSLMADGTDNPLSIILCVDDHPAAAVSSPNPTDSTCNTATPWVVTVNNNVLVTHDLTGAPTSSDLATAVSDAGNETAVWYEEPNGANPPAAYIAMIDNNMRINIKKVLVPDRGAIDPIDSDLIISFDAVPTGITAAVKDLSITGDDDELYVAYLASRDGSPASFFPQVRRIDLTVGGSKLSPNIHPGMFGFDYDGLGFTNTCTPAADCPATAASGISSIAFSPAGANITGSFGLVTPNGTFTVNFGTYNGTDTICSTCSGSTMASNLATLINESTDPLLAGYTASAGGTTVTIFGANSNDYFDAFSDTPRIADRQGKIYISGGNWYLPFINNSLGGSFTGKLSVYVGATGAPMSAESIVEPGAGNDLGLLDAALKFDNYVAGADLVIAMISKTGSAGKLYKVNPTSFALVDSDNIFAGEALLDIQVGASATNTFVGVTTSLGSKIKLGVYDVNGAVQDEFEIDDATNLDATSSTEDYFNLSDLAKYRIVPYGTEARLFGVSKGTTAGNFKLYVARLRSVSGNWILSCGDCQPVSETDQDISQHVGLGVAPVRDNPSAFYRLSTDGSVPNQGIKDVAFVSFGQLDADVDATTCDPAIGVFNVEGEAIGSSTVYSGVSDSGLYRSPFVKN